jgi:hypothetical protein
MKRIVLAPLAAFVCTAAFAAPVTYVLDPKHTYPSFAADHMGGLSVWRGKFTGTTGQVVYDKQAKSGTIDVTVDVSSVDFGNAKLDEHAKSNEIFDVAKYPTATYSGQFTKFNATGPTEAQGTFTREQASDAQDRFLQMHAKSHDSQGGLRSRCIGDLRPIRLWSRLRKELWVQNVGETSDTSRGQPGRLADISPALPRGGPGAARRSS